MHGLSLDSNVQLHLVQHNSVVLTMECKPLKRQTKIEADDILIFYFYLSKKIRLDFSCEYSA